MADLAGELTCAICLELYVDPRNLSCNHSFCRQCLVEIVRRSDSVESTTCPSCRECLNIKHEDEVDRLPKNFLLANIVDKFKQSHVQQQPFIPCEVCETDPPRRAVKSCEQCSIKYCSQCLQQLHPKRGAFAKHDIKDVVAPLTEQTHGNKEEVQIAQAYCEGCNEVYDEGRDDKHVQHRTMRIKKAVEARKVILKKFHLRLKKFEDDATTVYSSLQKELELVTSNEEDSLTKIEDACSQLIKEVKSTSEKAKDTIQTRKQANMKNAKEIEDDLLKMKTFIERIISFQNTSDELVLLKDSKSILTELEESYPEEYTVLGCTPKSTRVKCHKEEVTDVLADLFEFDEGDESANEVDMPGLSTSSVVSDHDDESVCSENEDLLAAASETNLCQATSELDLATSDTSEQSKMVADKSTPCTAPNVRKLEKGFIMGVHQRWTNNGISLRVNWTRQRRVVTYIIKCTRYRGRHKQEIVCKENIQSKHKFGVVEGLMYNSVYSVQVVGCSRQGLVESKEVQIYTAPFITGQNVTFSGIVCDRNIDVSPDLRSFVASMDLKYFSPVRKLGKFVGLVTSPTFSLGVHLWEIDVFTTLKKRPDTDDIIIDMGICETTEIRRASDCYHNLKGYCCALLQREKGVNLEFNQRSKTVGKEKKLHFKKGEEYVLKLGFLLDIDNGIFIIYDYQTVAILHMFNRIPKEAEFTFILSPNHNDRIRVRVDTARKHCASIAAEIIDPYLREIWRGSSSKK